MFQTAPVLPLAPVVPLSSDLYLNPSSSQPTPVSAMVLLGSGYKPASNAPSTEAAAAAAAAVQNYVSSGRQIGNTSVNSHAVYPFSALEPSTSHGKLRESSRVEHHKSSAHQKHKVSPLQSGRPTTSTSSFLIDDILGKNTSVPDRLSPEQYGKSRTPTPGQGSHNSDGSPDTSSPLTSSIPSHLPTPHPAHMPSFSPLTAGTPTRPTPFHPTSPPQTTQLLPAGTFKSPYDSSPISAAYLSPPPAGYLTSPSSHSTAAAIAAGMVPYPTAGSFGHFPPMPYTTQPEFFFDRHLGYIKGKPSL